MKTVAIISGKGGSGKTTIAVHLAVCALQQRKSVALIDIDVQGSAMDWYKARKHNEFSAAQSHAESLPDLLQTAKAGNVDLVIIDTAPHSNKDAAIAANLADLILIPCQPARFDLKAMPSTLDFITLIKTPAFILLNRCTGKKLAENARIVLRKQNFSVLDFQIHDRAAYRHAVNDGRSVHEYEPGGKAAAEIDTLYNFIKDRLEL